MIRIFLALTILGASAGGFFTARQSTLQLQHAEKAILETWVIQTQLVAAAQSEQAKLTEHVRELKQALVQPPTVTGSALWSALQTNLANRLPPELRQRLLEELGFNWRSSPDFIVVSKQTVRDIQMKAVRDGELTDVATTVLAMTTQERGEVEAAMQRVKTDFKDWVLAHVERNEPTGEVLAHYVLPKEPAVSQSLSNAFATAVFGALARERAELMLPSAQSWMKELGLYDCDIKPTTLIVKCSLTGNEPRLEVQTTSDYGPRPTVSGDLWRGPPWGFAAFPRAFRPLFPNGWPDVAKREGFELPPESQKK